MEMKVDLIPIEQIYADHLFNCRGFINASDVIDLAKSIERDGLLQPIVIQPFQKPDDPKIKYRIIAGYRRFTACRVNKMVEIPAIVREHMSDQQARILNLTENLKRSDLNKLQESEAIKPLIDSGYTEAELVKELGMSRGWVQIRQYIQAMDEPIKKEIAAGLLSDQQIRHLYQIKDVPKRYEYVKEVKKQKLSGIRKADVNVAKFTEPKNRKAIRHPNEILDMVETIVKVLGGGSLATIFGAWCGANTDDFTLHQKIQEEAAAKGIQYDIPESIIDQDVRIRMGTQKFMKVPVPV